MAVVAVALYWMVEVLDSDLTWDSVVAQKVP